MGGKYDHSVPESFGVRKFNREYKNEGFLLVAFVVVQLTNVRFDIDILVSNAKPDRESYQMLYPVLFTMSTPHSGLLFAFLPQRIQSKAKIEVLDPKLINSTE
jgi:hypothetical protein